MGVFGYGGSNQWGGPYCNCILKLSVDAEALPSQNKIEISSFLKMSLLRTMIWKKTRFIAYSQLRKLF